MKIEIANNLIYSTLDAPIKGDEIPVLFIHGFTGSSEEWSEIIPGIDGTFKAFAIDLLGHGASSVPDNTHDYTFQSIAVQIKNVLDYYSIKSAVLCGYSMGGRAAIAFSTSYPEYVKALILESSNPGIEDEEERKKRRVSDEEIANMIKSKGVKAFVDYWLGLPLFSGLKNIPSDKFVNIYRAKTKNDARGLINSLKGFGAGSMPGFWDKLSSFYFPVQIVAGANDRKFVKIGRQMSERIINSNFNIIPDCGHNTHTEKPLEFVSLVNSFLRNFY